MWVRGTATCTPLTRGPVSSFGQAFCSNRLVDSTASITSGVLINPAHLFVPYVGWFDEGNPSHPERRGPGSHQLLQKRQMLLKSSLDVLTVGKFHALGRTGAGSRWSHTFTFTFAIGMRW